MIRPTHAFKETPSQTAGPYVHIGLNPNVTGIHGVYETDLGHDMKTGAVSGEEIIVTGTVFDGLGAPVRDVVLEIWQADADGLFNSPVETRGKADPNFTGWGRAAADLQTGQFRFDTVKPGRRRRTFRCGSWRAASTSAFTRAFISPMKPRPMRRTRS